MIGCAVCLRVLLRCGIGIIQFRGFRLEYCVVLRGGLGAYFT